MCEFLGKLRPKLQDLEQPFRIRPLTSNWYLDEKKPRMIFVIPDELAQEFFMSVKSRFGKLSASNVRRAGLEAIREWIRSQR